MKTITFLASLALAACATAPEPKPEPPTAPKARAMAVHSVPTGMMVNVDNEWVGITPCVIMLPADSTGGFKGPLLTIIEAVPVTGGLQSTKMWWPKQRIPSRVVFTLPWAPRQPAEEGGSGGRAIGHFTLLKKTLRKVIFFLAYASG
jgi:hypothetical protein